MPRPSKSTKGRRACLEKANAVLYAARNNTNVFLDTEDCEIDDLPEELINFGAPELEDENAALELFNRLFKQAKKRGRPAVYTGLSSRTIRQKKQRLRKAAVGTAQISHFFPVQTDHRQPNEESEGGEESEDSKDGGQSESGEDDNQQNKEKIYRSIKFAERTLCEKISNGQKARYSSVILYFRLLLLGEKKMNASLAVAKVHGRGEYRARCVRKWAEYCLEGIEISNLIIE